MFAGNYLSAPINNSDMKSEQNLLYPTPAPIRDNNLQRYYLLPEASPIALRNADLNLAVYANRFVIDAGRAEDSDRRAFITSNENKPWRRGYGLGGI
ncbi:hypothetical protein CEXT_320651 [Caerostris extrusa]|uniref:Uncharacterized protein n=1 Tax=Caerostris extrusa TaxID=172846 RepID=A0AAV4WHU9_CAEEX|nr:hypothetical protein CEXT_320651 [Caerostris extrusa]